MPSLGNPPPGGIGRYRIRLADWVAGGGRGPCVNVLPANARHTAWHTPRQTIEGDGRPEAEGPPGVARRSGLPNFGHSSIAPSTAALHPASQQICLQLQSLPPPPQLAWRRDCPRWAGIQTARKLGRPGECRNKFSSAAFRCISTMLLVWYFCRPCR